MEKDNEVIKEVQDIITNLNDSIAALKREAQAVRKTLKAVCSDKTIDRELRWKLYTEAPRDAHSENSWIVHLQTFEGKDSPIKGFSWFDNFWVEKYQTVDLVEIYDSVEEGTLDDELSELSEDDKQIFYIKLKEEIMTGDRYFKMDW